MASELEDLAQIKTNIRARILDITRNPKPSYSIDGQSVDWNGYLDILLRRLKDVDDQVDRGEGPYEITTNLYT